MSHDDITTTTRSPPAAPLAVEGVLMRLAAVIESRKPAAGGDPEKSYVARLLAQGPDGFLKKIGEEACEVVMAAKDAEHGGSTQNVVAEMADLWFHAMVALAHYGLSPADVVAELARRQGLGGLEEKALRKLQAREGDAAAASGHFPPGR
ncbi:MAG: phosphoribosyl-ATP diphosphatase [Burkholderiaceae bacterium]|jgi:phosphoribosyl-ATP pyrophosphohydrolase|nr:phosphoribosyl-ATP diphosphatase [Burkholderiaceae bacterium]